VTKIHFFQDCGSNFAFFYLQAGQVSPLGFTGIDGFDFFFIQVHAGYSREDMKKHQPCLRVWCKNPTGILNRSQ
jgi:hypothetical protein